MVSPFQLTPGDIPTLYGQQKFKIPRVDLQSKINTGNNIRDGAFKLAASIPEMVINAPSDYQQGIGKINQGKLLQGVGQAGMGAFNITTMGGGTIAKDIGTNVVKGVGYPAMKMAIKQGAANGAIYGGGFGALSGLASSDNLKEQLKQVAIQGGGGIVAGAALGGGVGFLGNRLGAFKAAKLSMEDAPYVPQLRDAAGRFMKGQTPIKPKGMPNAQWKYQIEFNKKYGRNPYEPVFDSTWKQAKKLDIENKGAGLSIKDVSRDPFVQSTKSAQNQATGQLPSQKIGQGAGRTNQKGQSQLSGQLDNPSTAPRSRNGRTQPVGSPLDQAGTPYQTGSLAGEQLQSQPQLPQANQIKPSQSTSDNALGNIIADTKKAVMGSPIKEKKLITRLKGSEKYDAEMTGVLNGTYVPQTNEETIRLAQKAVRTDTVAAEIRARSPQNATDQAIGAELFGKYMMEGNTAKANEIINATSGTTQGQMVQILSQYDNTTPAGAVKFAQSTINNYNKSHPSSQLSLTDDVVKSLFDKASAIQKNATR
jgi:hypothetical protein